MPAPLMPPPTTSTSQTRRVRRCGGSASARRRAWTGTVSWIDERLRVVADVRFVSFSFFCFRFSRLIGQSASANTSMAIRRRAYPALDRDADRSAAMTPNPRQALLLDEVRARGSVSVEALAEQFGVTLQTVRRDVKLLADAGLLARFHGGVRVPSSTTENIAYRQRQHLNARGQAAHRPRRRRGGAAGLLAGHQHRHDDRGDRPRAAAPQGPARDHQQPQRRGDPVRQPRLRGDRRRRHRPLARPRHRRRGDDRLHPPVQGRHRPDRHLGDRGRRQPARLRLPRGEGGARDHRALARGLARRRPQQVQPAGDGRAGAPRRDRHAVHRRRAAARPFPSCSPPPASSCVTCEEPP